MSEIKNYYYYYYYNTPYNRHALIYRCHSLVHLIFLCLTFCCVSKQRFRRHREYIPSIPSQASYVTLFLS